jgi:hypothetical protein
MRGCGFPGIWGVRRSHTIIISCWWCILSSFPRRVIRDLGLTKQSSHGLGIESGCSVCLGSRYNAKKECDITWNDERRWSVRLPRRDSLGLLQSLLLIESPTRGSLQRRLAAYKFSRSIRFPIRIFANKWAFGRVVGLEVGWSGTLGSNLGS